MIAEIALKEGRLMVSGDLDFSTVPNLSEQSAPLLAQCKQLQFDLSAVHSANSAGLALLLEWLKYAKTSAKAISFMNVPEKLLQIAAVAGVDKMINSSSM